MGNTSSSHKNTKGKEKMGASVDPLLPKTPEQTRKTLGQPSSPSSSYGAIELGTLTSASPNDLESGQPASETSYKTVIMQKTSAIKEDLIQIKEGLIQIKDDLKAVLPILPIPAAMGIGLPSSIYLCALGLSGGQTFEKVGTDLLLFLSGSIIGAASLGTISLYNAPTRSIVQFTAHDQTNTAAEQPTDRAKP